MLEAVCGASRRGHTPPLLNPVIRETPHSRLGDLVRMMRKAGCRVRVSLERHRRLPHTTEPNGLKSLGTAHPWVMGLVRDKRVGSGQVGLGGARQRITSARESVSPAAKAAHPSGEATSPAAPAAQQAR